MHLNLFNYTEMLALVVSIIYFNRIRYTPFVIVLPYLLMVVCAELAGKYLASHQYNTAYIYIYNVTTVVSFITFYYLFYITLRTPKLWKTVKFCIPLYILLSVINQAFVQGFNRMHTHTVIIGTLLLIVFIFFYFYESLSSMEPMLLLREPMFWLSIGLLLYAIGDFTYSIMQYYLLKNRFLKDGMRLFKLIINNLAIFEYICISIAIITCRKIRPGSRLPLLRLL